MGAGGPLGLAVVGVQPRRAVVSARAAVRSALRRAGGGLERAIGGVVIPHRAPSEERVAAAVGG